MEDWLTGKRHWLVLILSNIIVAGLAFLIARWPAPGGMEIVPPAPTPPPTAIPTASPIRVYVSGAVASPGVYTLPPGSIGEEALRMAGGATADADPSFNRAMLLVDGQQVYIPRVGEPTPTAAPRPLPTAPSSGPVNVNTASASDLETLPGIGPVIAARIIAYRQEHGPFRTVDALSLVQGIGPATLDKIRDFVVLD